MGWSKDPGPPAAGKFPALSFIGQILPVTARKGVSNTKELSIFVDESGDFGPFEKHSPFYLFTLVLHDQRSSILPQIEALETSLSGSGLKSAHCFHIGPLIRREEDYFYMSFSERRRLLNKLVAFTRRTGIHYKTCIVEKRQHPDAMSLTIALSRQLSRFLSDNLSFFQGYERVVVYYDNGQIELNRILASVFAVMLPHAEFKRVLPAQYRLFQVADLLCTMELIQLKAGRHSLSKSEENFFGNQRDLKKNYLLPLQKLRIDHNL